MATLPDEIENNNNSEGDSTPLNMTKINDENVDFEKLKVVNEVVVDNINNNNNNKEIMKKKKNAEKKRQKRQEKKRKLEEKLVENTQKIEKIKKKKINT